MIFLGITYLTPKCKSLDSTLDTNTRVLLTTYQELRLNCITLEDFIGKGTFTPNEIKRLDKAITVMKVGFKMVKKIIRQRGVTGKLKPEETAATTGNMGTGS